MPHRSSLIADAPYHRSADRVKNLLRTPARGARPAWLDPCASLSSARSRLGILDENRLRFLGTSVHD